MRTCKIGHLGNDIRIMGPDVSKESECITLAEPCCVIDNCHLANHSGMD